VAGLLRRYRALRSLGVGDVDPDHPASRISIRCPNMLCRLLCLPTSGTDLGPPIGPGLCRIPNTDFGEGPF
jgi:hypothetical protein